MSPFTFRITFSYSVYFYKQVDMLYDFIPCNCSGCVFSFLLFFTFVMMFMLLFVSQLSYSSG